MHSFKFDLFMHYFLDTRMKFIDLNDNDSINNSNLFINLR